MDSSECFYVGCTLFVYVEKAGPWLVSSNGWRLGAMAEAPRGLRVFGASAVMWMPWPW
jgi:hypothetical protein